MNNIDPVIEELIRDSEKIRIVATMLTNDEYPDIRALKMVCGIDVPKYACIGLEMITNEFCGDVKNEE